MGTVFIRIRHKRGKLVACAAARKNRVADKSNFLELRTDLERVSVLCERTVNRPNRFGDRRSAAVLSLLVIKNQIPEIDKVARSGKRNFSVRANCHVACSDEILTDAAAVIIRERQIGFNGYARKRNGRIAIETEGTGNIVRSGVGTDNKGRRLKLGVRINRQVLDIARTGTEIENGPGAKYDARTARKGLVLPVIEREAAVTERKIAREARSLSRISENKLVTRAAEVDIQVACTGNDVVDGLITGSINSKLPAVVNGNRARSRRIDVLDGLFDAAANLNIAISDEVGRLAHRIVFSQDEGRPVSDGG